MNSGSAAPYSLQKACGRFVEGLRRFVEVCRGLRKFVEVCGSVTQTIKKQNKFLVYSKLVNFKNQNFEKYF